MKITQSWFIVSSAIVPPSNQDDSRNARAMLSRSGSIKYSKNVRSVVSMYTSAGMPGVGSKCGTRATDSSSSAIRAM